MMLRTVRPLLLLLLVLAIARHANACLSAPSNAGSCCSPAVASQMAVCCQTSPAASSSPCCSHISGFSQNSQGGGGGGWVAPQPIGGCSGAGCLGGSSGGGGCSGGGCANSGGGGPQSGGCIGSGCSSSANVGGGGSAGCANGDTGSGCSGSNAASTYDTSAEYETPNDYKESVDDSNGDGSNHKSGEANAAEGTVSPDAESSTDEYEESAEEHTDIPEENVEKPEEPPKKPVSVPEEHVDKSEESEEHIEIPQEKPHKVEKPEEESTDRPVEENTEESAYTDPPPSLPSRPKKSREVDGPEPSEVEEPDQSVDLGSAEEEAACQFLTCNFEDKSLCLYETSPDESPQRIRLATRYGVRIRIRRAARLTSRKWETASGQYHNHVTGVPKAGSGETFAAAYLRPRERAILTTDNLYFKTTAMLFQAYEATKGIEMRMCCDSLDNCPWSSNISIQVSEKKWIDVSSNCPEGTKKILFVCENSGKYQGACGLDNMRVEGQSCEETDPKEFFFVANK